jgi:hypothetical protein
MEGLRQNSVTQDNRRTDEDHQLQGDQRMLETTSMPIIDGPQNALEAPAEESIRLSQWHNEDGIHSSNIELDEAVKKEASQLQLIEAREQEIEKQQIQLPKIEKKSSIVVD